MPRADFKLRPVAEADLERLLAWRNSPAVRSFMYTDHEIGRAEHRAWFDRLSADATRLTWIFERDAQPLGVVNVTDIEPRGTCRWGFYIGEPASPKGSGLAMAVMALQSLFDERGMRKVTGEVIAFNEPSLRFHKRLGFVEEGRLRQQTLKNGRYEDVIIFSMLKEEWKRHKAALEERCFETTR
jgi:UDP-4-amino-4,6-dideoxy-N-acetyl-beta-L-altrosamine N-acetyltransferase